MQCAGIRSFPPGNRAHRRNIRRDADYALRVVHARHFAEHGGSVIPYVGATAVVVVVEDQSWTRQVLMTQQPALFQVDEMHAGAVATRLCPYPARVNTRRSRIE